MEKEKIFNSEYAKVEYVEKDNIVFLTWKQEAHYENYRQPTAFALELLRKYRNSQFVVDARNGFEDTGEDVAWGMEYLLPEIGKTTCKYICFILQDSRTDLKDEMDMWTLAFGKYLAVTKADSYSAALESFRCNIWADVRYRVKAGYRQEFVEKLLENHIAEKSRQEPGNVKYEMLMPIDAEDEVILSEIWTNKVEQQRHALSAHYAILGELKKQYVEEVTIVAYAIEGKNP